jgi:hypothetical protein
MVSDSLFMVFDTSARLAQKSITNAKKNLFDIAARYEALKLKGTPVDRTKTRQILRKAYKQSTQILLHLSSGHDQL